LDFGKDKYPGEFGRAGDEAACGFPKFIGAPTALLGEPAP